MQFAKTVRRCLLLGMVWLLACPITTQSQDPTTTDFFESKIRPVLVEHCYECHSRDAEEISGSLQVDSRAGLLTGGDSGAAIVKGDPELSPLISAIRYETSEMPPSGKLADHIIKDFEDWIRAGAIDPRDDLMLLQEEGGEVDWSQAREFWAFRPRAATRDKSTLKGDLQTENHPSRGVVDDLLNLEISKAEIQPNPLADPEVQLRRLCYDLTGLPPSIEMQDRWLADPSDKNWNRLVNELLASRGFGEHWARHWMDVARYADSNGSDFNATYHEAWRYREYLIRSFNDDRPFDEMIRQQIAGDLLPSSNDDQRHDNLVATTFLMLGPKMLSERDKEKLTLDVVDEQIDTVGRAFLGLTLGCARCHDHKFDPVPTEDYYALAGIFKSTQTLNGESQKYVSTWNRVELPSTDAQRKAISDHKANLKRLESDVKEAESQLKEMKSRLSGTQTGFIVDDADAKKTGVWKTSTYYKHFVGDGYLHDDMAGNGENAIEYHIRLPQTGLYEVRLSHSPGDNRAAKVPIQLTTVQGEIEVFLDQRKVKIEPMWSSIGTFELTADADTILTLRNTGTSGHVIADAVQFIPQGEAEAVKEDAETLALRAEVEKLEMFLSGLKKEFDATKKAPPAPLPVAMAPTDRSADKIADSPVHIRGEVRNLGAVTPRGFLTVCSIEETKNDFSEASGRLELAQWLTHPRHPLVARVFVNRVWMHLFGEGIVRSVDNFGHQGGRPSHPVLLDDLAERFVQNGWQLKSLIRELVSSHAYRRSSANQADAMAKDPENRLLWRIPRQRLTAESIRDSIVFSTGRLDRSRRIEPMAGRGVLVSSNNADSSARFDDVALPVRSIYLPIVRGYLPEFLLALDMADPDLLVGRRPTTNVPAQALVLINSKEVHQWAAQASERLLAESMSLGSRVEKASRMLLQRHPRPYEMKLAEEFFSGREEDVAAWTQYISAIYASSPFRFID